MNIISGNLRKWLKNNTINDIDEYVVLGEHSAYEKNDCNLYTERCTFFVSEEKVDSVLLISGKFWLHNFRPSLHDFHSQEDSINEPINFVEDDNNYKYETLISTWDNGYDVHTVWPSMRLISFFRLMPRIMKDSKHEEIVWDDLTKPEYDVVICIPRNSSISWFNIPPALAKIKKNYLIEFAKNTNQTILELFYVETRCKDSEEKDDSCEFEPGLCYRTVYREGNRTEQIYGVRPVIISLDEIKISPEKEVNDYDWPKGRCNTTIFVKDIFLREFEANDELTILPYGASVDLGVQWGFQGYRPSRNVVTFNTFDLNVPEYVLNILYKYRTSEKAFFKDQEIYGIKSIAHRAQDLCNSFYELIYQISHFFQTPIETLYCIKREKGDTLWWCKNDLKFIGYCAPVDMAKRELCNRCRDIIKYLVEPLKSDILRKNMERCGIPRDELKGKGNITLTGYLLQIIDIVIQNGYSFSSDIEIILSLWNKEERLPFWTPVFRVNQIRIHDSHSNSGDKELNEIIRGLEIDPDLLKSKSGLVLDRIYETLTNAFQTASDLIYNARSHC